MLDVAVRRLRLDSEDDRTLCAGFATGDEEWERQVSEFITRKIWLQGRAAEHTLLAIDIESGRLFGFGAWKHQTVELPQRPEPVPVVRICYFGVDAAFKGAVDMEGRKWASRLYSTLEDDARRHEETEDATPFELFCDQRNVRGLRFWTGEKRGFVVIGPGALNLLRLIRVPPE